MPPLPIGSAGLKVARGMTKLGWHWWPEFNSINSAPYDGRRPCVQRSTCQSGCNEGAKASTDLTHWPKAIAGGRAWSRGPASGGSRPTPMGWPPAPRGSTATDASNSSRRRCRARRERDWDSAVAAALLERRHPDGLANSSGLVGKRLMMHPFANVAGCSRNR